MLAQSLHEVDLDPPIRRGVPGERTHRVAGELLDVLRVDAE
eukprot:CAMPEP_0183589512 /NCGR_PEP_ID=MMETSP0371-20130417/162867_1 /TAXON_ID=268820 /ORGANISM="Peridinium aciculiferum, Strain PAER-2" /LENGTH=40 /DNA_ID= /DNA_START= /DNA_END= /DNA_ORIENTATION=